MADKQEAELPLSPIEAAYARYDSDKRVHGPDDFQAFRDAVLPLMGLRGPRDVTFVPGQSNIPLSFGVSLERIEEIDSKVREMFAQGINPGLIIMQMAANADISDNEYTVELLTIGYFSNETNQINPGAGDEAKDS